MKRVGQTALRLFVFGMAAVIFIGNIKLLFDALLVVIACGSLCFLAKMPTMRQRAAKKTTRPEQQATDTEHVR